MKTLNLSFCLFLWASFSFAQNITRGPYLQLRTQTSIQFRYNTGSSRTTFVKYGLTPTSLANQTLNTPSGTSHIVNVTGLTANTKYYYAIYSGTQLLEGTDTNYFITTQSPNSEQKIKIWATGDCGIGGSDQVQIKDKFLQFVGQNYIDAWLLLGDNAYGSGTDGEFQANFFNPYQNDRIMKQTTIYPVPGNHDYFYNTDPDAKYHHNITYYDIFANIGAGQMGGLPSNHKEYYSFDIGNAHFIALDSYGRESSNFGAYALSDTINSPQIAWLKNDLAANQKKWTIIYWHHPPYSMGTHNTDTEEDLVAIRKNLIPIIERYNVDLVLNGHSHNYERSKMMKGHFGLEASFSPTQHLVSTSSGYYDGSNNSCPYHKKSNGSIKGTVYAVAGSSAGNLHTQTSSPHEAMPFYTLNRASGGLGGSVYIEIEGNRLDFKMIGQDGNIFDKFSMVKDLNQKSQIEFPSNAVPFTLKSPYKEPAFWENSTISQASVSIDHPIDGMAFQVQDTKNCFKDTLVLKSLNPCENLLIIDRIVNATSQINVKSANGIRGSSILSSNTSTILDAKGFVELMPGFETKPNSIFTAKTGGCSNLPPE
jgi:hypothetical protein